MANKAAKTATGIVTLTVKSDRVREYAGWQHKMIQTASRQPGYLMAESVDPEDPDDPEFVSIFRFDSPESLNAWLTSKVRADLLAEISDAVVGDAKVSIVLGKDVGHEEPVTAVITARVAPGQEEFYEDWQERMNRLQAKQPGNIGNAVQKPIPGMQDEWVIMTRYDSPENLERWMHSKARKKMKEEAEGLVTFQTMKKTRASFDGWFNFKDGQVPPRPWQQSAIVLLVLFPTIVLEILLLSPFISWMGMVPATFVSNVVSVILTGFVFIPAIIWMFKWWVRPNISPGRLWSGFLLICALYVVLIVVLIQVADVIKIPPIASPFG